MIKKVVNNLRIIYFRDVKKRDYFTITIDGQVSYVFYN